MDHLRKELKTMPNEKNRILKHIARILAEENQITVQEQFRILELLRKE
ncbi:MAG: hypothetical protein HFI23_05115 [Lachnospiraceae bacterium]|nr:hypothetical protein [Lachnospiraceae bacterium]